MHAVQEREVLYQDCSLPLALFALGFALRAPCRNRFVYHWDCRRFAPASGDYSLARSQLHARGCFLYVVLGRLANWFVGESCASLVWISVVAGAALGYLLGTSMLNCGCGLATPAILATSPLCWFYSEIAMTNIVDAALITAAVLTCRLGRRPAC